MLQYIFENAKKGIALNWFEHVDRMLMWISVALVLPSVIYWNI